MTACFFIPSIAPSIFGASNGFAFSPSGFGLTLRYCPEDKAFASELEKERNTVGGKGERGAVALSMCDRVKARLLAVNSGSSEEGTRTVLELRRLAVSLARK